MHPSGNPDQIRIDIDAASQLHGGGLTYLASILDAWVRLGAPQRHSIRVFLRPEGHDLLREVLTDDFEVHEVFRRRSGPLRKVFWEHIRLPIELRAARPDVLWCPLGTAPLSSPTPVVMVMHNAGPFCQTVRPDTVGIHDWLWYKAFGLQMRAGVRTAARVIFLSHYLKDIFVRTHGFPPERAEVIYNGIETSPVAAMGELPATLQGVTPYVLCVSHLYPHKNLPTLIEGFALAAGRRPESGLRLAIAGKAISERYGRWLERRVCDLGMSNRILFLGLLSRNELKIALRRCAFFVFQSMCENCPISLLEALAAGTPILCSEASVMPEICKDAALYFDPQNPQDICQRLLEMLDNPETRSDLGSKSRARALCFPSWDEVAIQTLRILEGVAMNGQAGKLRRMEASRRRLDPRLARTNTSRSRASSLSIGGGRKRQSMGSPGTHGPTVRNSN